MSTTIAPVATAERKAERRATSPSEGGPFVVPAEHGGTLALPADGCELVGADDLPVVVVLGGISASRHVFAHAGDETPGWWGELVGEGRAIDPRCCRVLGMDYAWRTEGPVSTRDQARLLAAVLDRHGIARVHAIAGSSYGGMVALAFAEIYPERVDRLVIISAAHEPHPMATAVRVIQRRIIRLAQAAGRPQDGVALARALGVTTYRTADEFADRFASAPLADRAAPRFPVEDYLDHQSATFATRFTDARYLSLSESLDLHRADPARIAASVTLIAVDRDTLVPPWQMRELFAWLRGPGRFVEISSRFGHDAFLKEVDAIGDILTRAIGGRHGH